MTYVFQDLGGLALGTIILFFVLVVPGFLISKALDRYCPLTDGRSWNGWSPVFGLTIMPVVDATVIRMLGIGSALVISAVIAVAGLATMFANRRETGLWGPGRVFLGFMGCWWIFCAVFYVDVDAGGRLHQSLAVLDLVKHAAVVREIAQHGLPMQDPFFLRDATAGYYHYFYDAPAIAMRFSGGLVDSRMAFVAGAFWTGAIFPLFLFNLVRELGWQRVSDTHLALLCGLASTLGGFDVLGVLLRYAIFGRLEANAEWWDDEISFVPTTASWVPHHLTAVIAVFLGIVVLCRAETRTSVRERAGLIALAGVAFAAAFGLSVWVTIGAVFVLGVSVFPLSPKNWRWISGLVLAGAVAFALSLPQLLDLMGGRTVDQAPLAFSLREPVRSYALLLASLPMPIVALLTLVLTPLVWIVEFGVFALGSWLFHRTKEFDGQGRLLVLLIRSAIVALILNLLVRSTVINNDFGWRVAWFAAVPALIWTICAMQTERTRPSRRIVMPAAAILGLLVPLYNLVAARLVRPPWFETAHVELNADPTVDHAMRLAYDWANRSLPDTSVLQHNPGVGMRSYDFGLYSNHRVVVADRQANLFGADREEVGARVRSLEEVFAGRRPYSAAIRLGATHLVVTKHDAIWSQVAPHCGHSFGAVCIVPLTANGVGGEKID